MTRTTREILAVCRDLGVSTDGVIGIARTHAGYWQRSTGAWSWYLTGGDAEAGSIGGYWSAREVIKAHKEGLVSVWLDDDDTSLCVNKAPTGANTE